MASHVVRAPSPTVCYAMVASHPALSDPRGSASRSYRSAVRVACAIFPTLTGVNSNSELVPRLWRDGLLGNNPPPLRTRMLNVRLVVAAPLVEQLTINGAASTKKQILPRSRYLLQEEQMRQNRGQQMNKTRRSRRDAWGSPLN